MKPQSGRDAINAYCKGTMSARPEFYSGRGVMTCDLGPKHLAMIHAGILQDFDQEAADQFCLMVENLTDMSATNFLNQFHIFFANGCRFQRVSEESSIDLGPDGPARVVIGFASIMGRLNTQSPEYEKALGEDIKTAFFEKVGHKPTKPKEPRYYETSFGFMRTQ